MTTDSTIDIASLDIDASRARRSDCHDRADARDVDVSLTLAGRRIDGEVTLLRDHAGRLGAWGGPDHWVSDGLLAAIRDLGDDDYTAVLSAIEAEASAVAEAAEVVS